MILFQPKSAYRAKIDGDWEPLISEIAATTSDAELLEWKAAFLRGRARTLPGDWLDLVLEAVDDHQASLGAERAMQDMDRAVGEIARGQR